MAVDTASVSAAMLRLLELLAVTTALHLLLPQKFFGMPITTEMDGYVRDVYTGKPLRYRLNGIWVMLTTSCLYILLWANGIRDPAGFSLAYRSNAIAAFALGMVASVFYFIKGRVYPVLESSWDREGREQAKHGMPRHPDYYVRRTPVVGDGNGEGSGKAARAFEYKPEHPKNHDFGVLYDFYSGHEFNPRPLPSLDLKMFLYLWGATLLQINILAILAEHRRLNGTVLSNASIAWAVCLNWFAIEYMYHEHVHLYTYDLFNEKVGFKLIWGCIFFYPMFYGIGGLVFLLPPTAERIDISPLAGALVFALFLVGWVFTRGPNMQKFAFKRGVRTGRWSFLGLLSMDMGSVRGEGKILNTGFWAVSRHVNFFGEILQSMALSVPCSLYASYVGAGLFWQALPWLYPLYYIALFVPREIEDGRVCRQKYGKAWEEYEKQVPWRIVPGLW
ncbi:ergosterol biosynthesis ERG4/ERG24 family-domain-containing protein [Hyaloraphidium curvatum]|nr:ergosterol biosynthesis ERG4/ERG24 family-domain-containing protein [Hyaloraphidium curvatum]